MRLLGEDTSGAGGDVTSVGSPWTGGRMVFSGAPATLTESTATLDGPGNFTLLTGRIGDAPSATLAHSGTVNLSTAADASMNLVPNTGGGTNYPAQQVCAFTVGDNALLLDAYWDGADFRQSDAGNAFAFHKLSDEVQFEWGQSGGSPGDVASFTVRARSNRAGAWRFGGGAISATVSFEVQFIAGATCKPWGSATTGTIDAIAGTEGAGLWSSSDSRLRLYDGTQYRNVAWVDDVSAPQRTVTTFTAGATINQWDIVASNGTANQVVQATGVANERLLGVAIEGKLTGQPIQVCTGGEVTVNLNAAVLVDDFLELSGVAGQANPVVFGAPGTFGIAFTAGGGGGTCNAIVKFPPEVF